MWHLGHEGAPIGVCRACSACHRAACDPRAPAQAILAHPLALAKLGMFLRDVAVQRASAAAKRKPIVLVGPADAAGMCLVVGVTCEPFLAGGAEPEQQRAAMVSGPACNLPALVMASSPGAGMPGLAWFRCHVDSGGRAAVRRLRAAHSKQGNLTRSVNKWVRAFLTACCAPPPSQGNTFGQLFLEAAEKADAKICSDGFDSSVIEVGGPRHAVTGNPCM